MRGNIVVDTAYQVANVRLCEMTLVQIYEQKKKNERRNRNNIGLVSDYEDVCFWAGVSCSNESDIYYK